MNKILSVSLLTMAVLAGAPSVSAESEVTYSYAPADSPIVLTGTNRKESYDIAIALKNPALYGLKISEIQIPVIPSAEISDVSAWTTKELALESKVNKVDQSWPLEMPAEGNVQYLTVKLEEGYVVPEGGIYVGYSLTVDKLDNVTMKPIVTTAGTEPGSFYIHSSRSYRSWEDKSAEFGVKSLIQVKLLGDIAEDGATLGELPVSYAVVGESSTTSVMVYNIGTKPIESISYTAKVGDKEASYEKQLATPIAAIYGFGSIVDFEIPASGASGDIDMSIQITGINGKAIEGGSKAEGVLKVVTFIPKKLALVEEYTGTWCGYCPRGFVAMEEMSRINPDFVGIAYHNGDQMTMLNGYPDMVSGFPSSYINRSRECDPFYADQSMPGFSMPAVYSKWCEGFVDVGITVEAVIDDSDIVTATADVVWAASPVGDDYRIEYVLVADDLTSPDYAQSNYYSGDNPDAEPLMAFFCEAPSKVYGLHFNDVAIMTSGLRGVEGSIPSIEVGKEISHTYTFNANEALNDKKALIPYQRDKLRVVAFVLEDNGGYGKVINATKCDVKIETGIRDLSVDRQVESISYYDLQGRRITNPGAGIYIRSVRYTDGTVKSDKLQVTSDK